MSQKLEYKFNKDYDPMDYSESFIEHKHRGDTVGCGIIYTVLMGVAIISSIFLYKGCDNNPKNTPTRNVSIEKIVDK